MFCQLETLRQCLPQSVRHTLNELPESLDETYERLMMEIKRANQVHAYRMLQCLTVAVRPLSVAELAELLAFDFDAAKDGIPKLKSDWRWENHEQAVLSTCSSLITVVPGSKSPVVQFSHFSVKEFLMSDRLAKSPGDISQYHISLLDAHTVLTRACLGVLLRDPGATNGDDPLAPYAAEHWVAHAQVDGVTSRVRDGMESLFDPDKPYLEAWIQLHDPEPYLFDSGPPKLEPRASPLYYAALCGFHELVEHFILKDPQSTSSKGGCGTAIHAASFAGHLQIVQSLLRHGVEVDVGGYVNRTPLHFASESGHRDVVQCLIDHGADVNSHEDDHGTPLNWAAYYGDLDVVRMLLEHHADVNTRDDQGRTPLHDAVRVYYDRDTKGDHLRVIRLLLEHGADVDAKNESGETPSQVVREVVREDRQDEILQLFSDFQVRSGKASPAP